MASAVRPARFSASVSAASASGDVGVLAEALLPDLGVRHAMLLLWLGIAGCGSLPTIVPDLARAAARRCRSRARAGR